MFRASGGWGGHSLLRVKRVSKSNHLLDENKADNDENTHKHARADNTTYQKDTFKRMRVQQYILLWTAANKPKNEGPKHRGTTYYSVNLAFQVLYTYTSSVYIQTRRSAHAGYSSPAQRRVAVVTVPPIGTGARVGRQTAAAVVTTVQPFSWRGNFLDPSFVIHLIFRCRGERAGWVEGGGGGEPAGSACGSFKFVEIFGGIDVFGCKFPTMRPQQ